MNKLVVIDDDPINHFLMQHILRGDVHFDRTTYALNGDLVLDYIEENKDSAEKLPDVIFLDLNMPQFSGWDFLDRFKQLYQTVTKDIKIFVMTSSIIPADRKRTEQYPFVKSFINKPLKQNSFRDISQEAFA